jgi:hypothetical protein
MSYSMFILIYLILDIIVVKITTPPASAYRKKYSALITERLKSEGAIRATQ